MFNVLACSGVPAEVCHRLGLRLDLKISLRRLVHPSPNFTGGGWKSPKCGLNFWSQSPSIEAPWFRNTATCQKSKTRFGAPMIGLHVCPPQIWYISSTKLRGLASTIPPPKKKTGGENLLTHLLLSRSLPDCWNLIRWCIVHLVIQAENARRDGRRQVAMRR